jgi:hypothetical protein
VGRPISWKPSSLHLLGRKHNTQSYVATHIFESHELWNTLLATDLHNLKLRLESVVTNKITNLCDLWRKKTHSCTCCCFLWLKTRHSAVDIATGYGQDGQRIGVRVSVWGKIFLLSMSFRRVSGSPSLLYNGYRGLFPRGWSGWSVKLTTHLQLVPRSRIRGSIHALPHTSSWRSA